jgi:hypothetical protein
MRTFPLVTWCVLSACDVVVQGKCLFGSNAQGECISPCRKPEDCDAGSTCVDKICIGAAQDEHEAETCGNRKKDAGEICDDGNAITETTCPYGTESCVRCNANCSEFVNIKGRVCGDGVKDPEESCDDGNRTSEARCPYGTPSCTRCSSSCTALLELTGPSCGDGHQDAEEACDDGNLVSEEKCPSDLECSACSADCREVLYPDPRYCGNGEQDLDEACDSAGIDSDSCNADCTPLLCGDGYRNGAALEVCDIPGSAGADCTLGACAACVKNNPPAEIVCPPGEVLDVFAVQVACEEDTCESLAWRDASLFEDDCEAAARDALVDACALKNRCTVTPPGCDAPERCSGGTDGLILAYRCVPSHPCRSGTLSGVSFGRGDIAACGSGATLGYGSECSEGWHLCTAEEYLARNDSCSGSDFYARIDDGPDCVAAHDSHNNYSCWADYVADMSAGTCTGTRMFGQTGRRAAANPPRWCKVAASGTGTGAGTGGGGGMGAGGGGGMGAGGGGGMGATTPTSSTDDILCGALCCK